MQKLPSTQYMKPVSPLSHFFKTNQ